MLLQKALAKILDRCRPSFGVPERRRISIPSTHVTEHPYGGAPCVLRRDRSELSDHHTPRAPMPTILDQEEALATRHDADAKARQLLVEDDVVLLPGLEALDESASSASPWPSRDSCQSVLPGVLHRGFVEASWKQQDGNRGALHRTEGE